MNEEMVHSRCDKSDLQMPSNAFGRFFNQTDPWLYWTRNESSVKNAPLLI